MQSRGWWSKEDDDVTKERLKQEVMTTFRRVEKLKRHELKQLFEDIYGGEEPWNIVRDCQHLPFSHTDGLPRENKGKSYLDSCESTETGTRGSRNWTNLRAKGKS